MSDLELQIRVLTPGDGLPLPSYATEDSAGLDLYAAEEWHISPGGRTKVRTGLCIALPKGTVGYIHPRSGRAFEEGLALANGVAVLDADYRGELLIPVINLDPEGYIHIMRGDRIAQLVILPYLRCTKVVPVKTLPATERGAGGFGSTGR